MFWIYSTSLPPSHVLVVHFQLPRFMMLVLLDNFLYRITFYWLLTKNIKTRSAEIFSHQLEQCSWHFFRQLHCDINIKHCAKTQISLILNITSCWDLDMTIPAMNIGQNCSFNAIFTSGIQANLKHKIVLTTTAFFSIVGEVQSTSAEINHHRSRWNHKRMWVSISCLRSCI